MTEAKLPAASILLVEDEDAVARTVADVLETSGYKVRRASDGAQAELAMQEETPDLVVLDLILPDVDGLVLCSNLKAIADVPIIICSATTRKRDTVLGLKLGADDFISK